MLSANTKILFDNITRVHFAARIEKECPSSFTCFPARPLVCTHELDDNYLHRSRPVQKTVSKFRPSVFISIGMGDIHPQQQKLCPDLSQLLVHPGSPKDTLTRANNPPAEAPRKLTSFGRPR